MRTNLRSVVNYAKVYVVVLCVWGVFEARGECTDAHKAHTSIPKIAVIGSGMAGASVAWRLAHESEEELELTIFEAEERIGGRLDEVTVHGQFEDGVTEKVVELGGTMGIEANRYFVEATDLLNLTRELAPDPTFGIFDGNTFTMTSETPLWRKAWRYKFSPYFQNRLTSSIVKKFLNIYDLQDRGVTFSSALHLWKGLDMEDLLHVSLSEHLRKRTKVFGLTTINKRYIDEVVAGQVRVNYNQNPHEIAALAAPEHLKDGEAAAALLKRHKSIPGTDIEDVKYQTVYTTYVRANPKPDYFKSCKHKHPHATCRGPKKMPEIILTTESSDTAFSCVGVSWKPPEASGIEASVDEASVLEASGSTSPPRLNKLFSVEPLTEAQVQEMFFEPEIVAQKFWKAYPQFVPPEVEEGRMQLAPGLYYTNALEAGASCIEIAAVAARNVAMLMDRELKDRSQIHTCS